MNHQCSWLLSTKTKMTISLQQKIWIELHVLIGMTGAVDALIAGNSYGSCVEHIAWYHVVRTFVIIHSSFLTTSSIDSRMSASSVPATTPKAQLRRDDGELLKEALVQGRTSRRAICKQHWFGRACTHMRLCTSPDILTISTRGESFSSQSLKGTWRTGISRRQRRLTCYPTLEIHRTSLLEFPVIENNPQASLSSCLPCT